MITKRKLHRYVGATAGIVILFLSISGLLLTFFHGDSTVYTYQKGVFWVAHDKQVYRCSQSVVTLSDCNAVNLPQLPDDIRNISLSDKDTVVVTLENGLVFEGQDVWRRGPSLNITDDSSWRMWLYRLHSGQVKGFKWINSLAALALMFLAVTGGIMAVQQWKWKKR